MSGLGRNAFTLDFKSIEETRRELPLSFQLSKRVQVHCKANAINASPEAISTYCLPSIA